MPKGDKLAPKEELFCQYYVNNSEFFGNGTRAYANAYGMNIDGKGAKKKYKTANVLAVRMLAKDSVRKRITELLNKFLKNDIVDGELAKVIMQDNELASKVGAIREYNRVKKRVDETPKTNIFNLPADRQAELAKILKKNI
jgi:hypothetical protein